MNEVKKCAQCGQEKPIEDFSKSYKNLCKECVAENMRAKRHNPTVYFGGGHSMEIPEDAAFISPMRFQSAVAAMQGMLSNEIYNTNPANLAKRAIEYADALLNELKKKKDEMEADK